VHKKENPQKPPTKVKKTREEMQTTLENRKKATTKFLRNAFKRKNRVEEGALSSKVKREHESTYVRAQKMMRGKVEPSTVLTIVQAMLTVVRAMPTIV
jgi:hypothetical protein